MFYFIKFKLLDPFKIFYSTFPRMYQTSHHPFYLDALDYVLECCENYYIIIWIKRLDIPSQKSCLSLSDILVQWVSTNAGVRLTGRDFHSATD